MNIRILTSLAVLAAAPSLVLAEPAGAARYSGNALASQICKAVVDDDPAKLRMLLRSYRQSVAHGYRFDLSTPGGIAQDFTCNNYDLQQFSARVGAQKVTAYFAGDAAAVQSQVAASSEYAPR